MGEFDDFFKPEVIAIVGASDNIKKVGGRLFEKALKSKCRVVPINPNHEFIFGKKCYKSILDVPCKVDLVVIAIPAEFVHRVLEDCIKKKIKSVIVISAGFAESGNHRGEHKLAELSKEPSIKLLGPNCFGIFYPEKNLDLTFSAYTPKEDGKVAFISQSGALWSYVSDLGIPVSAFVSLGNMADLEFSDFMDYFCEDKKTKAVVLYIEKLKDGKRFMEICRKCRNKKIYAVMAGASAAGKQAVISHTASLASDYRIYQGMFKQTGIISRSSLLEAFEKAYGKKFAHYSGKKVEMRKRAAFVTNAGGAAALMMDYLSEKNFEIKDKPIDVLGPATAEDYKLALETLKKRDDIDSIFVILTPQSMSQIWHTAEVVSAFSKQTDKDVAALFLGSKSMKEANFILESAGVTYFNTLEEARERLEAN